MDTAFDTTFALLEQGTASLVGVDDETLHGLDMYEASRLWDKAKRRLLDDPDGALTLTRTLLESVCKKILDAFSDTYSGSDTTQHLCSRALSRVVPTSVSGRDHFRHFTRSIINLVEHISLYRSEQGDAHGSPSENEIEVHQAAYAVNLAGSTALFLIECYRTSRE